MASEIERVVDAVPFAVDQSRTVEDAPGFNFAVMQWQPGSHGEAPSYWSPARDGWLREFVTRNGPLMAITNTFINKIVTIPFSVLAHDRSIARHVKTAKRLEQSFRRNSGSMSSSPIKGFKEAFKMFWLDYLTQDNGGFMLVMGDGPADGPIVGAPYGVLHLDSALCVRTKDPEFPVKYHNVGRGGDNEYYKIHYTRIIEMANMPSANVDLNGVGRCAVSCCLEAAQELWDIYKHSSEMFGSRPPRQILYAESGATVATLEQAIAHWNMKLDNENRSRFGGTLIAAPGKSGQELRLKVLNLSQMPEGFNRRDTTTINMSALAAAFGLDLRDVAYTLGAPSRTGDAEVQDRKGRGKGVGEALETFTERFNEVCVGEQYYIHFDYLDDEQDEQQANIRQWRSEARQRDLITGLTTIRVEREFMLDNGEISQENFDDMELSDGRLPDGLDVLLLFQSQEEDYSEWLDLGIADPTNVSGNDPEQMIEKIHDQQILVAEFIHLQTQPERRRKARQALAALEKLRLMYQDAREEALQAEAAEQQMLMAQPEAEAITESRTNKPPVPPVQPGRSPTGKEPGTPPQQAVQAGRMRNGQDMTKQSGNSTGSGELATKQLEEIEPTLDLYGQQMRGLVDNALQGTLPEERFVEALATVVLATLMALFLRGARKGEAELTPDEWGAFFAAAEPHFNAIRGLGDDLYGGRYASSQMAAYARVEGWLNMATGIFHLGETYRADDPFYQWVYSVFKDHCRDCVRLDGQVHRASEWRAAGWLPKSWRLECHGINCGCSFQQVEGPSRGGF